MLNLSHYQMQNLLHDLLDHRVKALTPVLKKLLLSQRVVLSGRMCEVALYNVLKRASSTG